MNNLASSIAHHVDSFDTVETGRQTCEPVRIAILDSGFDRGNPLLMTEDQRLDPRIKDVRNFVHQTEPFDVEDEIGHGTHALGLLLNVATCAEIYIARIASRETLDHDSYDSIANVRPTLCLINFATRANYLYRPSTTQSLYGKWTLSRCHSEFVNITSP